MGRMGMMGMGKMGMMGMGKMGMMGMGMMGMGEDAPEPPPVADEAEAVGDPHMTLTSGEKADLCCEGGDCKPCPVSLLQEADYYSYYYYESLLQFDGPAEAEAEIGVIDGEVKEILSEVRALGMGRMGMGRGMMGKMGMGMMGKMGMMGMGMMGMGAPEIAVEPVIEDEAAAVGDPHLTLTSG